MSSNSENGVVTVNFDLRAIRARTDRAVAEVMKRDIAPHALRESVRNAPVSPTVAQLSATLVRKRRTSRRMMPHGLEKSIQSAVTIDGGYPAVSVFVSSNSPAGKYAKYIHDEKGIKWHKRGIGTQRKGQRADDKFIERAVRENARKYRDAIAKAVAKAINQQQ